MKRIAGSRVPVKTSVLRHLLWVLFIIALVLPVSRVGGMRAPSAESLLWANMETPYGITFAYPNPWGAQPGVVVDQYLPKWEMRVVSPIDTIWRWLLLFSPSLISQASGSRMAQPSTQKRGL